MAHRSRRPRLLAPLIGALFVVTACTGSDDDGPEPLPELDDVVASNPTVRPETFCDRIDERALDAVLGEVTATAHYDNGDTATLAPDVVDVAHEFNCSFTGDAGQVARAWVFVPPVTAERAEQLVDEVAQTDGCKVTAGRSFGEPGVHALCADRAPAATVTQRGLFTDTWFACSLTYPDLVEAELGPGGLASRADDWCAAALAAASSS